MRLIDMKKLKDFLASKVVMMTDYDDGIEASRIDEYIDEFVASQQPEQCEDAVSRAEAKKILYDFAGHIVDTPNGIYQQAYKTYMSKMDKLPSVTPKQRTGKWIFTKNYYWICSECGKNPTRGVGYVQGGSELFPHCPYCGSRNEVTT